MNKHIPCTFSQKWDDDPFTELGHTQAPNALIEYGARIGLTMAECWLVTCILKFKYTRDDPYPSQLRLAEIVGKDEDTVRRILKSMEKKNLLVIEKVRGDLGHFTHSVYNFGPLRYALNEAYYADHPQDRPATVQNRTVAVPPRKTAASHPAKTRLATVQKCGPNKSLEREEKRVLKEPEVLPSVSEEKKPAGRSPAMSGATAWLRRREGKPDAPPK